MKFLALIPLVFSIVAFVLVTLATFAGRNAGFMEDYAVVRLNMSGFGQDLLTTGDDKQEDNNDDDEDDSVFDKLGDLADDAIDKVTEELNDIGNDLADKLASALGISEWYSLHILDSCEGMFEPNATSTGPSLNVTNCTDVNPGYRINLTEILDKELDLGPFDLNLADLNWPDGIQRQVNKLNRLLLAVFVFYALCMGFSGLCILVSVADFLLGQNRRSFTLLGVACAGIATLSMLIGAAITTYAAKEGSEAITDIGENVGVYAEAGDKFITISWVAFAAIAVATLFWTWNLLALRKQRRSEFTEKRSGKWRF